jgi:agmatine deiminase
MRYTYILVALLFSSGLNSYAFSDNIIEDARTVQWEKLNPDSKPHWLTAEERTRLNDLGRTFTETEPPQGDLRNVSEFDRMQGVLIRYPFGISYNLIAELSQETNVTTIVSSSSAQNTVSNNYANQGVNLANCTFLIAPSNSYWTRDYGPWFVQVDDEISIVNFPYNRPRPADDEIPVEVGTMLGVDVYGMDLVHAGGNYMTCSMNKSASSELVLEENPGLNDADINTLVENYLGVNDYYKIPDPNGTYIDHIDCWGKFLDTDKVLLREVPESHSQYDEIEAVVAYFESLLSAYGNPYQIFRVWTPQNQPYTNSLILNDRVFVPITGSSWDDDALAAYESAMPGYEILGFTGSWESTDALHCRTKGIADIGMLSLSHIPLFGNQVANVDWPLSVDITACSGSALVADSLSVYYRVNSGNWQHISLNHQSGDTYTCLIPAQTAGTQIEYYLQAADQSSRFETHPFIGPADPHVFYSGVPQPALLEVDPLIFNVELTTGSQTNLPLQLTNAGDTDLNWALEIIPVELSVSRNIEGSYLESELSEYSPGQTVDWIFTVYNQSTDDEWLTDIEIDFPAEINVISSTAFSGGSSDMNSDNASGNGAVVHWNGVSGGWGVIHDGESAQATVSVSISSAASGNLSLGWSLQGDEYGDAPHYVSGDMEFSQLTEAVSWIDADLNAGILAGNSSQDILLTINSTELAIGNYHCVLQIDAGEAGFHLLPVNLGVIPDILQTPVVEITLNPGSILLNWQTVTGAGSYRVESTTSLDAQWIADQSGVYQADGHSWSAPIISVKRFYRVVAVD